MNVIKLYKKSPRLRMIGSCVIFQFIFLGMFLLEELSIISSAVAGILLIAFVTLSCFVLGSVIHGNHYIAANAAIAVIQRHIIVHNLLLLLFSLSLSLLFNFAWGMPLGSAMLAGHLAAFLAVLSPYSDFRRGD
jgi:hypothetical protein